VTVSVLGKDWKTSSRRQVVAHAQRGGRVPKVGYIYAEPGLGAMEGLLVGLRELGYLKGQSIRLVRQLSAAPTVAQTKEAILAVLPKVDILVVAGTIGGVAAKAATSDVPVVFISVGAVDIGLVKSLAKPGGNLTGVTFEVAEKTYAKRLQLLTEFMPGVSRRGRIGSRWRSELSVCDGFTKGVSSGPRGCSNPSRTTLC
jgi:putative ABC transport system substrate-binding protein